uniref:Uncharacterized protein n=1 Tax=Rousettus aegyptiacus TaxID=9407 RepID=A0A7J8KBG7_ROUAE|nr:hypothetical protein HJG63_008013 [Rousettus aegyptiacus]
MKSTCLCTIFCRQLSLPDCERENISQALLFCLCTCKPPAGCISFHTSPFLIFLPTQLGSFFPLFLGNPLWFHNFASFPSNCRMTDFQRGRHSEPRQLSQAEALPCWKEMGSETLNVIILEDIRPPDFLEPFTESSADLKGDISPDNQRWPYCGSAQTSPHRQQTDEQGQTATCPSWEVLGLQKGGKSSSTKGAQNVTCVC